MSSNLQHPTPIPPLHPPGRSGTRAAWSALLVLLLFFLLFFFHSFLLRMSVRSALWILQPVTGLTIKTDKLEVVWGKPIHWHQMTISAGKAPFATQLTFQEGSLKLASWWRLFFGDHLLIASLQATQGKGIIDLRTATTPAPFWKKTFSSLSSSLSQNLNLLPASIKLRDTSFLLLTTGERYTIDHLSCTLPNKLSGQLAYESILIEAGTVHCHLKAEKCKALWDGKKLSLRQLPLANEIALRNFTMVPHRDRIELGIIAEIFDGLLRADGSLRHTPEGTFMDSALLGEQLPLGRLSRFLGLKKNLSGTLREGRVTFRGLMLHPMDAEASLRMMADNVRLEKRGWASLVVTAHLIGHKISLTDFQLKQHENRVAASGEITLPEEWHKIAQAPFLFKLKANISDASQLADLMGTSWNNMTGKLFADGEVHGAANHAEGYLNVQGSAMTAYELPLNSLKLQLLFQGKKTQLTNFDLWSGSDHLECAGVVENQWPHHYEGKASLQSNNLSEKFIPFLQQHDAELPSFWSNLFASSRFEKLQLQGGSLQASWEGRGEATRHEGSFDVILNNLFKDVHRIEGHGEGSYGPKWISFSSLTWKEALRTWSGQLTFSPRGIDLKNFSLMEDQVTTLSGNVFLPLDVTTFSHHSLSFSPSLLRDLPLSIHLQCHHFAMEHEPNFPWNLLPTRLDGTLDASGLLATPSLHLSLTESSTATQRRIPKMKFHLSSEQGEGIIDLSLTRIFHDDSSRGAAQRDAGKADEDLGAGLYSTYRPSLNRSPTQSASRSRKPQQIHREICGLATTKNPMTTLHGKLNLSLEEENHQGVLHGKVSLQQIEGMPKLFVTPFLIPPGINIDPFSLIPSSISTPWTIDMAITTAPEKLAPSSSHAPFGTINLHLTGNLFSPTLEGNIALQHLPLIFPNKTMKLLEGSCNFDATHPWQPLYNLTASDTFHGQHLTASLLKDHTLQLQSDPFISSTTLALELALPNKPSSDDIEIWLSQLPYWLREQSLMEPTTLMNTTSSMIGVKNRSDLGFIGCGISYRAEMK